MGTYVVTGASAGIGREVAILLARQHHRVLAIARSAERLEALAATERLIVPLAVDLADANAMDRIRVELAGREIDGLINNAAIQENCRFDAENYGADAIRREITINLTAPIMLTHLVAQSNRRQLTVVNVNSALALFPKSTSAVYSVTKAGLRMFGTALAAQPGSRLRVVNITLPLVDTAMTAGRGSGKIAPPVAAAAIVAALDCRRREIFVGKAIMLRVLATIAPGVAARIMRRM